MIEKWIITDGNVNAGFVYYNNETRKWKVEITNTDMSALLPAQLIIARRMGDWVLTDEESYGFIKDRVIPANRMNIQEILEYNHFPYYDEYFFIKAGGGRCCNDEFYLKQVFS